jgi:hypothetical protein
MMRTVLAPFRRRSIRNSLSANPRGHPEVLQRVLQQAVEREGGVVDVRDRGGGIELLQQRLEQRRLARADLAGEDDEAFTLLDAVLELGEGFPVPGGQEQEPGVRGEVERVLRELIER